MNKFSWQMALVDAIPVVLFMVATIKINMYLESLVFALGIICCTMAGLGKVIWKLILAFKKKDIQFFFKQFRVLMPGGFLLMCIAVFLNRSMIDFHQVLIAVVTMPKVLFFIIGIIGIVIMGVLAKKLDPNNPKSNWIEQGVNCIAQGAFMLGVLL